MLRISQHLLALSTYYATHFDYSNDNVSQATLATQQIHLFFRGRKETRLQVIPRHSYRVRYIGGVAHPRPIKSWAGPSVLSVPTDRSFEGGVGHCY